MSLIVEKNSTFNINMCNHQYNVMTVQTLGILSESQIQNFVSESPDIVPKFLWDESSLIAMRRKMGFNPPVFKKSIVLIQFN